MIGVRTPFRISLSGGSTDIESFYKDNGGKVISSSINKFMYHFIHKFSKDMIQVKYSKTELVKDVEDIEHPIVRETGKLYDLTGLDINSIADVPKGSGLGSSSAYTVGLINGLSNLNNEELTKNDIANLACDIEINKLSEPIGKQDQFATALGGFNILEFKKDGSVKVNPLDLEQEGIDHINNSLTLVRYGESRDASKILSSQKTNMEEGTNIEYGKAILDLVNPMVESVKSFDIKSIGELLTENWNLKSKLSNEVSSKELQVFINELLKEKDIYGCKLLGAGKSGYILVAGEKKKIKNLRSLDLLEFNFENSGTSIILKDNN